MALYLTATFFYPGGSQADSRSIGFSWLDNYWCNLLNDVAINGEKNGAQPIALTGMLVLCITMIFFWIIYARHSMLGKFAKNCVQVSGVLSMTVAFFLFTPVDHDLITNVACFFGGIAILGTIAGLYKSGWYVLFNFGLLNLLLAAVNNYLYYNPSLIRYLPLIQKISFASFLIWICCITVQLYRHTGKRNSELI